MIRPYNAADKGELLDIFRLNMPEYFDPKELADYEKYLDEHAQTYFTVEHEGNIAGGVGYHIDRHNKQGQITWILFHPGYAGLGLGRKSVRHCLEIFKSDPGIEKLVVTTSQKAYQFFEKLGYRIVNTEKDYWGQGLDLYLMERQP
ncbi:GNAT family N-acetyltransferase [Chitinophaga sp. 22321]|uniref:GNAT family N-acetyltransferase n=1 Tax=Chitinophaga hostae TaxID=2831022 RepID=A0ABS5J4C9_9BACT|nr:GNAT family N-acetyltransferase [Chitinophaga hostae]MBS0030080.1 GNAT family N-acetyltransferase [Chitinophaga hostae]